MSKKECWMCGESTSDKHHIIPQDLNPKKNQLIPLCNVCHGLIHNNDNSGIPRPRREIVYFYKHTKDKITKIQGTISNGKIIFPDRSCEDKIKPNKYYDVEVFQTSNTAFARNPRKVLVFGIGRKSKEETKENL